MDKKEYLQTVAEHIRCVKARDAVKMELEHHIEDQKEAFMMDGMKEEEASRKAVEEMGDPVETGITLDLIHRPKMQWKMIVAAIGLSVLGLLLQYVLMTSLGQELYGNNYFNQIKYVAFGMIVMFAFCFLDYSRIGLYGKFGAVLLLLLSVYCYMFGVTVNGQSGYMRIGVNFSIHQVIYFYIPFFGGILYSYKGQGKKGLYKSIAWMIAPVAAMVVLENSFVAMCLSIIMMIQLAIVVQRGWISVSERVVKAVTAVLVASPVVCVLYFLCVGQNSEYSLGMQTIRELLMESTWIGQRVGANTNAVPFMNSDFVMTYVAMYYGRFVAVLLIGVLAAFVVWLVKMSIGQKNQLGMVMGIGCSLVFAIQTALYVLVNASLLPASAAILPMFSYGGTGIVVCFGLLGILLSIYRYQNVLPVSPCKKRVLIKVQQELE